jgi:hypothetical protein
VATRHASTTTTNQTISGRVNINITGPLSMELALGISAASRRWFVDYTLLKSVEHNDKGHSVPARIPKEL